MKTLLRNMYQFGRQSMALGVVWTYKNYLNRRAQARRTKEQGRQDMLDVVSYTSDNVVGELRKKDEAKFKIHTIHLESTLVCNLRCPGCMLTQNTESGVWKAKHMAFEDFQKIAQNLPGANVITMHNYGEPTMNPRIRDMVATLVGTRKFDRVVMTTNLLTHDVAFFEGLFDIGMAHMTVSIDTFDPELVKELRTRTKVDKLRKNIDQLIKSNGDKLTVATVVSQSNIHDVPNTLGTLNASAKRHGQKLHVSLMKFDDNDVDSMKEKTLTAQHYLDLRALSDVWKKQFKYLHITYPAEVIKADRICLRPLKNPKISVEGIVEVCGRHLHPALDPALCDLRLRSYEEIFRDPRMIEFIEKFIREAPGYCPGCESHYPRKTA